MLAGLVNFDRALGELYVELAPHPRGWDYLRFEAVLCMRACFRCSCRPGDRSQSRDVAVPSVRCLIDAAGGSERVCVHMWVSCQVTFMIGSCCMVIGWIRDVKCPGYNVFLRPDPTKNTAVLDLGTATPTCLCLVFNARANSMA